MQHNGQAQLSEYNIWAFSEHSQHSLYEPALQPSAPCIVPSRMIRTPTHMMSTSIQPTIQDFLAILMHRSTMLHARCKQGCILPSDTGQDLPGSAGSADTCAGCLPSLGAEHDTSAQLTAGQTWGVTSL